MNTPPAQPSLTDSRYRLLFETIEDGFVVIEMIFDVAGRPVDYRFREFNPAFTRFTGIRPEEVLDGKTAKELFPTLEEHWFQSYGRVARTGESMRFENRAEPMNKWFEVHAFRIGGDGSNEVGVLFKDVSERRAAEAAVTEQRARQDHTLQTAQVATFDWDPVADQVRGNALLADFFGITPTQDGPLPVAQYLAAVHPDDRPAVDAAIRHSLADGTHYETPYRVIGLGGRERWILARGDTTLDDNGRAVRFSGVLLDITARKKIEAERQALLESEREARAEAERQSRTKDEFLATLSHELRTPLNAILGWSQIVGSNPESTQDVTQGIEIIERNARAQAQIIDDLLDMSRIISGKVRLDVQRIDLAAVTRSAVETAWPTAEAKGVKLQSVIDPLGNVVVSGDASRLQQVLWNLLTNAIKFTPRGGQVQVVLRRVESHLELGVIDSGEGIKPDFLPHVFDRFRQADGSTTRRHGGLGLGLSIVKQLVELHGGSVQARSEGSGRGAAFVVALPITPVSDDLNSTEPRRHPTSASLDGRPARMGSVDLTALHALVVDDEADARHLVQRLLSDCGAIVATAGSVTDALRLLETKRFDVVVSDIGMPGGDGYELARRVRALPAAAGGNVPTIALTAYARTEDRVKALAAGFRTHLAKPIDPTELLTVIANVTDRLRPV